MPCTQTRTAAAHAIATTALPMDRIRVKSRCRAKCAREVAPARPVPSQSGTAPFTVNASAPHSSVVLLAMNKYKLNPAMLVPTAWYAYDVSHQISRAIRPQPFRRRRLFTSFIQPYRPCAHSFLAPATKTGFSFTVRCAMFLLSVVFVLCTEMVLLWSGERCQCSEAGGQ